MTTILLIDDDEQIGLRLKSYFQQFSMQITCETHPASGLETLQSNDFDLVILDIMMPDINGLELCKRIRQLPTPKANIPILMLSARGDVMDRVVGIEIGADDYLAKPFEPRELVVRTQAILKRSSRQQPASTETTLSFGSLSINIDYRQVFIEATEVTLTSNEYRLLALFAQAPGKNFSRDEILNHLKGIDSEDLYTRSVDILVSRLRNKLKPTDHIKTVWGSGYSFIGHKQ